MEEFQHDGTTTDATVGMIDEGCTVQLMDGQNAEIRSMPRMHVEFDNLSYCVCYKKGKLPTYWATTVHS